jgi:hypothetical protein
MTASLAMPSPFPRFVPVRLRHFTSGLVSEAELETDRSVEETSAEIVLGLELPLVDADGRPQRYEIFARRGDGSAERLPAGVRIGDVVREGDEIEAMPEVQPGRGSCPR